MLKTFHDSNYKFDFTFDNATGFYMRTGILDEHGNDTGIDPFMAEFPHLIDVGIMGHCLHGELGLCVKAGIGCYQNGLNIKEPNMRLNDFKIIAEQCNGRVNQFALGGRGDPDMHDNFEDILRICKANDIVPNFTTSGYGLTQEKANICKKYCGAVAVSWYRSIYTLNAIDKLLNASVKTNIHFVISNSTIDEAILRLRNNDFPTGINAVLFLLHKPAGIGKLGDVLDVNNIKLKEFFSLLEQTHPFKVGIDSCTVPGIINFCENIMLEAMDTCEGGRFSCYIDAQMNMTPCSFDQEKNYYVSLNNNSIIEAWNSNKFNLFRNKLNSACPQCNERLNCMGGCPLYPDIVLCNEKKQGVMK